MAPPTQQPPGQQPPGQQPRSQQTPGQQPLKGETRIQEPTRAQRTIARRAAEARATIPDLEFGSEVHADPALGLARRRGVSLAAILVRACAVALSEHPRANGAYRDGRYELYSRVNVAVTVQTDESFITPTLLDSNDKSLEQLTSEIETMTTRARSGELTPPDLAGATFTVTDFGTYGVSRASAFVTPPHAAALAAGAVREVPMLRDGTVTAGHTISVTLACDARILFGAAAAGFLSRIVELLESGDL